jgi:transcription elongation factor GreA-like protein
MYIFIYIYVYSYLYIYVFIYIWIFLGLKVHVDEYSDGSQIDDVMQLMLAALNHAPQNREVKVVLGKPICISVYLRIFMCIYECVYGCKNR